MIPGYALVADLGYMMLKILERGNCRHLKENKIITYLINIFTGSPCCNGQLYGKTIDATENLYLLKLFKILCAVTWKILFLASMVMKAVRGQKHH